MRKFFCVLLALSFFALPVFANCCVDYDKECCAKLKADWKEYKVLRDKAKADAESGDTITAIASFKAVYDQAEKLQRADIMAWQMVNSAHTLILAYIKNGQNLEYQPLLKEAKACMDEIKVLDWTQFAEEKYNIALPEKIKTNTMFLLEHLK